MNRLLEVKGIGKVIAAKLAQEGIDTPEKLIERFPNRYLEKKISAFCCANIAETITLTGTITSMPKVTYIRKHLTKLTFQIRANDAEFSVSIFNREFLKNTCQIGAIVVVTGKFMHHFKQFTASEIVLKKNFQEGIEPIYHLKSLGSHQFHKIVQSAMLQTIAHMPETIPADLISKRELPSRSKLFSIVHSPKTMEEVHLATKRIKYEELLLFSLRIEAFKKLNQRIVKTPKSYRIDQIRQFIKTLPFELTTDQKEATNAIFMDLKAPKPMNRLLQGDVGSGKTICAIIAALAVVTAGYQVAFMSPTEILARQHYQTLQRYLEKEGIQPVFLTKNVTGAERQRVLEQMQNGTCSVIVGTHALIQDALVFHRLGMVVIDEQHRFGVNQRKALREKGGAPDCLFLSATPIPRSLAIALFGDMDISTIKSMPSGRQPIKTTIVGLDEFDSILPDIRQELDKGHQAYMICPLIAESETMDLVSVSEATREIKKVLPKSVSIAMLHGKMKSEEKAKILDDFFQGNTAVLVSTTVVEVGLDCPNATVMIILNAERFGLAQIHQIRGRVGRGHSASSCYLIVNPELEIRDRLGILEKTNDGFQIAEADLDLRGPGEVFGEEQTGIPRFKMANMVRDIQLMEVAFADAKQLIDSPDPLSRVLVHTAISEIQAYFLD